MKTSLSIVALFAQLFCLSSHAMGNRSTNREDIQKVLPKIHKVEVHKADRRLELLTKTKSGYQVVKSYSMNLGGEPLGHKTQEGDRRTPEGLYTLDWKNPKSAYHLSIHISYPNKADKKAAQARGVNPGGDIMIHGMPNETRRWTWLVSPALSIAAPEVTNEMIHSALAMFDWTQGCIAVQNSEMEEIYRLIDIPTPIEIFP